MSRHLGAWQEILPEPLSGARLVLSESDIGTTLPVPMHGRVDQVFYSRGWLIPVDTKTRKHPRVFVKDIIQLSVYAFILSRISARLFGRSIPVSSSGYVRCVNGKKVQYIAVNLLSGSQVIALWNRYWELKKFGLRARPKPAPEHHCIMCPKKDNCPRGRLIPSRSL